MPEALAEAANLVVRPLHPVFGAEVTVRDRAGSAATVAAEIERCLATAGLVVIRDVALDDAGLARFAGHFGPLQDLAPGAEPPGIFHVTNLDEHGNLRAADDPARLRHEANKLWHVDSSFIAPGVSYSFLHARIVPEADKDTLFCDGRAAWDALDDERPAELLPMIADHAIAHSYRLAGLELPNPQGAESVTRKLVRTHAPSGRRTLVIPSHVARIHGLDDAETRALLDELTTIAATPDKVYRHKWRAGDLVIWDNRCILHRASRAPAPDQPRDLRTCRIVDVDDDGLATT